MGIAILTLAAGIVLGALVVYRLWCALWGVSWTAGPLARVTRKEDPFSFWTSVLPVGAFALVMMLAVLVSMFGVAKGDPILTRTPSETSRAFVRRVLNLTDNNAYNVTEARWNGTPFLFVDYSKPESQADPSRGDDRILIGLQRVSSTGYRKYDITIGEVEGDEADVRALGFAGVGSDPNKQLLVLLAWDQHHAAVQGTIYEVRIFDYPKPGQQNASYMKRVSEHFNRHTCECERDDGTSDHFPFKTIAAIKTELKRMRGQNGH